LIDTRKSNKVTKKTSINSCEGSINSILFSHCENFIFSGSEKGKIVIHDLRYINVKKFKTFSVSNLIDSLDSKLRFESKFKVLKNNQNLFNNNNNNFIDQNLNNENSNNENSNNENIINLDEEEEEKEERENFEKEKKNYIENYQKNKNQIKGNIIYDINNLLLYPNDERYLTFTLSGGGSGLIDILNEKLIKLIKIDKQSENRDDFRWKLSSLKPSFISEFNHHVFCLPSQNSFYLLDWSNTFQHDLYYEFQNHIFNTSFFYYNNIPIISKINLDFPSSTCFYDQVSKNLILGFFYFFYF
jgi:hypothetical protein